MPTVAIDYDTIPGTAASLGRHGVHTVIADRAEGKARGSGLGFGGGPLLALALGGCFSNTAHFTAEKMGLVIERLQLHVEVDLEGEPLVATRARLKAECKLEGGADPSALLGAARVNCMVANTLRAGVHVTLT
jgi:organic hydroperoxide reductase OsmC/OhrA